MPFIMPEGTRVPTGTDNYDLTADLRKMAESQSTIVSVASVTMRTAMVAAMTAAGRTPSPTRPLWVDRQDLPVWYALEYTTDGTTWKSVPGEVVEPIDYVAGFNGTLDGPIRTIRQGNIVTMAGSMAKSAATSALAANTPLQVGSPRVGYRPFTSRRLGYAVTALGPGELRYDSTTAQLTVQYAAAQTITSGSWWISFAGINWTMDA